MKRPLDAIVVGAGYFAQFHIEAWQRLTNVRLRCIVEANTEKHSALKEQYDNVAVLASLTDVDFEPDIVDIASPPATHTKEIKKALDHTQALIICQKPFCGSLENAAGIVKEAQQRKRSIVVHENFRFQPWYRKIHELLQKDFLGTLQQATFRLRTGDGQGPDAYLDRQPYFQEMPRFLIHETGIHFIDVFRFLFGEPDSIAADLRRLNPAISGEDAGSFTFIYDNGMRAIFDGNRHLDHAADNTRYTLGELLVEGTLGALQLNGNGELQHRRFGSNDWQHINYQRNNEAFAADCVYLLQAHVVQHLMNGSMLENRAQDYLQNQALEELVYRANETGAQLPVHLHSR